MVMAPETTLVRMMMETAGMMKEYYCLTNSLDDSEYPTDTDSDGICNTQDNDDDGDGVMDVDDLFH